MQNIFRTLDFFIMRTPILSADIFECELTSFGDNYLDKLWELAQEPLIREAVAVSSMSLLNSLTCLSPDNPIQKREHTANSFLRYLIRMSTRPTPFGIFSGVSFGKYGTKYKLKIKKPNEHKKRTRPDMEWIYRIIAQLEREPNVVSQLELMANTTAYEIGSRVYLPYIIHLDEKGNSNVDSKLDRISVNNTSAVKAALEMTKQPLPAEDIISRLQAQYPDTSFEQISDFINQLLKQELLISNLRPPLLDVNPLHYLIDCLEKLKDIEPLQEQLKEISSMIDKYDTLPLGKGEEVYQKIIQKMQKVSDCKNFLQVDLKIETDDVILPPSIKEEVEKAANVLWKISNNQIGLSHMIEYKNDFIEKYGTSREIPLLELLDEEIGLGAPATYEFPPSRRTAQKQVSDFQQRKKYLLSQWLTMALLQGNQELVLDEHKLEELSVNEVDSCYAPRSFELYFSLSSTSKESIEAGSFLLTCGPTALSHGAGKSIGRFADILGSEFKNYLKNINTIEQEMDTDVILAELVYLPIDGRASNVSLAYRNRDYEIVMGTTADNPKNTIPLSDLVVGIDDHGLYLRSLKFGKEVIATTNHMLNTLNCPNVYRFLRELSVERQKNIEIFNWGEFESFPFLPRIRYSHCILSPARWVLNEETLPSAKNECFEEWVKIFNSYRNQWKIPRFVYLTEADTRLLLDLDENKHVEQIYHVFSKLSFGNGVILTEVGHSLDEFTQSGNDRYCTEFVFPLVKNPIEEKKKKIPEGSHKVIHYAQRLKLPGSEWLYVKWYGASEQIEKFLGGQLRNFCEAAEQKGWTASSFFMRYADPAQHIRLRFFAPPEKLQHELFPQLNQFAQSCLEQGFMTRMVFDTYDPEIERYGGTDLMPLAEQWFCIDSKVVMNWISLDSQGILPIDKDMLAVISIIDIMEQFGMDFEEQFDYLDKCINYKEYLDVFRAQRSLYLKLGDARNGFAQLQQHEAGQFILPAFQARRNLLHYYAEQLALKENSGEYYVTQLDAMSSLIHLHLNRLYGINREDEKRVLTLARHTLHSLKYIRRKDSNKNGC